MTDEKRLAWIRSRCVGINVFTSPETEILWLLDVIDRQAAELTRLREIEQVAKAFVGECGVSDTGVCGPKALYDRLEALLEADVT